MRILHVISSVNPQDGGPVEAIRQLDLALPARGHSAEVVSVDDHAASWVVDFPLKVHALGPSRTSYRYSPSLVPWLQENAPGYDAVIVHGLWQYHSFAVWRALHGKATPYFVYTHGMLDPWFKRTYPLKHLKKSLYWPWGEYRVLRDARAVLFTCEEEKLLARESFTPYQVNAAIARYCTSVPDGDADAQRAAFLAAYPALTGKRLLLFLSRIHAKKGCDLLLEAFARVADADPTLHLVMAGPDQSGWQAELQSLAERLGVAERITWTGMLGGDLKWGAFHASEAFVLTSHQENFGIAVTEALSCGLPVLISNKINIWREIAADGAGLVAEDTQEGAARLLQEWLGLTPEARQQMATHARQCFAENFEIEQAAQNLLDILGADQAA